MELGNSEFESGEYADSTATLSDSRATTTTITSADEAMIYEKVTGSDADLDGEYVESPDLLNPVVIFDNRVPPSGFEKDEYQAAGVKFITYTDEPITTGVTPVTDMDRFNTNVDRLTYRFSAAPGQSLAAIAKMQYQSHSRPFMDMLKENQPAIVSSSGGPAEQARGELPADADVPFRQSRAGLRQHEGPRGQRA